MSKLKVGAAKVCISPTLEMMPFPNWESNVFDAIYDDCFVRAIVIDNGEKVAAILAYELAFPPMEEEVKKSITAQFGIPAENIMVSAIHNHTGAGVFSMSSDATANAKAAAYNKLVFEGALEAVKKAKESMKPAKYGFGEGQSLINTNRDRLFEDGYWMQSINLSGYSDKTLAVLKFVDLNGNLIAALLNHGTHATCAFTAKDIDGKVKISGNFPGITCRYVENRFGDEAVVAWTSGAAGNQNPIFSGTLSLLEADGYSETSFMPNGAAYVMMEYTGQTHAVDAIQIIKNIDQYSENMPISFTYKTVLLPAQKAPEGADMAYNRLLADNLVRLFRGTAERPEKKLVEMIDDPNHPVELKMQLAILGDVALVGIPAEIYAEIGRDCKTASPFKKTVVVTHTSNSVGYILDKTAIDKKVFQSFGRVKPGMSDELIINAMLEMFDKTLEK